MPDDLDTLVAQSLDGYASAESIVDIAQVISIAQKAIEDAYGDTFSPRTKTLRCFLQRLHAAGFRIQRPSQE